MDREKELYLANSLIDIIEHVQCPMLMYEAEKEVAKNALRTYIDVLEKTKSIKD